MTVIVLFEAESEFRDAAAYYESKEPGLGVRFRNEVASKVDWISQNFDMPRLRPHGYRRVNLQAFPHYIAYVIRNDIIWVVAISHSFRRPEYWIERIK